MSPQDHEIREATRAARSALSLRFELVSCTFASVAFNEATTIPVQTMHHPCIVGKAQPDQDCRSCSLVRVMAIGSEQGVHRTRYHGAGHVFPLDAATADAVVELLVAHDAGPLQRPIALNTVTSALQAHLANEAQRANDEQQQRSPYIMPVQGD